MMKAMMILYARRTFFFAVLLLICEAAAAGLAQNEGVTAGTVSEIAQDYLLVQPTDGPPMRHYFAIADGAHSHAQDGLKSAVSALKVGNTVETRWVMIQDRRTLVSVILTAVPAHAVVATVAPSPATGPSSIAIAPAMPASVPPPSENTTGQTVNSMIDNLLATASRLLDLPLYVLLGGLALGTLAASGLMGRWTKQSPRRPLVVMATLGTGFLIAATFIVDRKIMRLQDEVMTLRTKVTSDAMTGTSAHSAAHRTEFLFDAVDAHAKLAAVFGECSIRPAVVDDAADFVQFHSTTPLIQAYIAIIDLKHPKVSVELQADFNLKTLTSSFAKENGCSIAINGEAGESPEQGSGLGDWRGYMIRQGQAILKEEGRVKRPFLSFARDNVPTYISMGQSDRSVPASAYNLIWGRFDALVNGAVQTADERNRQPRTAMAVDQSGSHLYLMVVDGRQARYSIGFTRAEAGQFLKAFGAYNGMLCDEGGSSCIYVKSFGGIANIPSDNAGQERPTYTHFGISVVAH